MMPVHHGVTEVTSAWLLKCDGPETSRYYWVLVERQPQISYLDTPVHPQLDVHNVYFLTSYHLSAPRAHP